MLKERARLVVCFPGALGSDGSGEEPFPYLICFETGSYTVTQAVLELIV